LNFFVVETVDMLAEHLLHSVCICMFIADRVARFQNWQVMHIFG